MRIVWAAAGSALLGAIAVGVAGPALADDDFKGMYSVVRSGISSPGNGDKMWNVIPCGSGCVDLVTDSSVTYRARPSGERPMDGVPSQAGRGRL
jgi:hypothetical protein